MSYPTSLLKLNTLFPISISSRIFRAEKNQTSILDVLYCQNRICVYCGLSQIGRFVQCATYISTVFGIFLLVVICPPCLSLAGEGLYFYGNLNMWGLCCYSVICNQCGTASTYGKKAFVLPSPFLAEFSLLNALYNII